MEHFWTIDFEIVPGMPALDTADQQARVAIELASTWHLPDAETMKQLLESGKLTTECIIDGKNVSLILKAVE